MTGGTSAPVFYCTINVSEVVCVVAFEVAFTFRVYVPAGVPFGFGGGLPVLLPPPQEHKRSNSVNAVSGRNRRSDRLGMRLPGWTTIPSSAKIHNPVTGAKAGRRSAPAVRGVVVTLTLKVAGTVELNGSLTGTEQFAPIGEPEQLSDAVPLRPAPPIDSV